MLNALAVAVFVRLATPAVIGEYYIVYAVTFVTYSIVIQWIFQSHFAHYREGDSAGMVTAVLNLSLGTLAGAMAVLVGGWAVGWLDAASLFATVALLVALTAFYGVTEIGRAHLLVGPVALLGITRAVGVLVFGVVALRIRDTSLSLVLAVSAAHLLSTVPVLWAYLRLPHRARRLRAASFDMLTLLRYGWPLALAAGAAALSISIDRLILNHFFGAASVAPYAAAGDFLRQSFVVLGEAISLAYVSQAKSQQSLGAVDDSRRTLQQAFVAISYVCLVGGAGVFCFGPAALSVVFPENYQLSTWLLGALIVGNIALVARSYYFGQMIYFGRTSWLEVAGAATSFVVAAGVGLVLIPRLGVDGTALGFALAQLAGLAVFVTANAVWHTLPIDRVHLAWLAAIAATMIAVTAAAELALGPIVGWIVGLGVSVVVSTAVLWRWNLFDIARLVRQAGGTPS